MFRRMLSLRGEAVREMVVGAIRRAEGRVNRDRWTESTTALIEGMNGGRKGKEIYIIDCADMSDE